MDGDGSAREDRLLDLARRMLGGEAIAWDREGFPEAEAREAMKRLTGRELPATEADDRTLGESTVHESPTPLHLRDNRFIGDFRIVRKLGEGGMGVVYEAEQQHPRRPVALKVIRGGAHVSADTLKLFQREVQALARLRHPGIAALYETGATDEGLHFFAMELVPGPTLAAWLEERRAGPTTPEELRLRLATFKKICDAVAYAHQRGVIHRDLKPGNVLVPTPMETSSKQGTVPDIKVLDFGLARMTDSDVQVTSYVTALGKVQGTVPYMSPEQIRGNTDEIDLRTDVYSLGVILYEMVTGRLPYDLSRASLPDAVRIICETAPKSVSATFTGTRRLDADVATIATKCLEKEASRRYQTAAQLGEDVQRYLSDQPILARPPSAAYQLRKLAARHKGAFAFAATVLVLLTALAVTSTIQAVRISRERDRANREAETAKQVSEFLAGLFKVSDPGESRGKTITAREILDAGAKRLESELAGEPLIAARLMDTVAQVYYGLGLYDDATHQIERSLSIRERLLGDAHRDTLESFNMMGMALSSGSKLEDAERYYLRALEGQTRLLGSDDPETLATTDNLGRLFLALGKLDEAERYHREALGGRRRRLGSDHDETLTSMNNLGLALEAAGKLAEAEPYFREVLERRRRVLGNDHPNTLASINNLGFLLLAQNKPQETLPYYREALEGLRRVLGNEHPTTLLSVNNMGFLLQKLGRLEEAEPFCREAFEGYRKVGGGDDPSTLLTMGNLGDLYTSLHRYPEAGRLLKAAVDAGRRLLPRDNVPRAFTVRKYGRWLTATGRYQEAETTLRDAYDILVQAVGAQNAQSQKAAQNLAELYTVWRKPGPASEWRMKASAP